MSEEIRCFLIEPTGHTLRSLRRWTDGGRTADHQHRARKRLDVVPTDELEFSPLWRRPPEPGDGPPASLWPSVCDSADGYEFASTDMWQLSLEALYRRAGAPASDEGFPLRLAPPGAMWEAPWMAGEHWAGPDGRCLVLQTPAGEWVIDGPSADGGRWTRQGEPPELTANPSIRVGDYHGWLRGGVLRRA